MTKPALDARGIAVAYGSGPGARLVVGGVELTIARGRTLGLAGESGCGKSTLALAITGFQIPGARRISGQAIIDDTDLLALAPRALSAIWGRRIAYVPQNAATALDPRLRIGEQLLEPLRRHLRLSRADAQARARELLQQVGLPDPDTALARYAHQFSGGQQQRIAIAIAISCHPEVLLLDEPTTGLDVTTQARINTLIRTLVAAKQLSTLYISHNLALLASVCDELAIMYAGEIVEHGDARHVFADPRHPYTQALVAAVPSTERSSLPTGLGGLPPAQAQTERCAFAPRCAHHQPACNTAIALLDVGGNRGVRCVRADELGPRPATRRSRPPGRNSGQDRALNVERLSYAHRRAGRSVFTLHPVDLAIAGGEVLGIAGESGSGKTTLLKAIAGLLRPSHGTVRVAGVALHPTARRRPIRQRRRIQLIFQNPDTSLNPRHTVRELIERPITLLRPELTRPQRQDAVTKLLASVQLPGELIARRPGQLSGGQRQRVAIARALAADPDVLLCDEITSALDVSIQASILELLSGLRDRRHLAMLFVTHDLGVLRALADRVIVMRDGRVLEQGATDDVFASPSADYTRELLAAVPTPPVQPTSPQPSATEASS